jgi:two-component system response regulator DevR
MSTTAPLVAVPVRVVLVDPQEICRRGIACTLADDPDVGVVGQAGTVSQAHQLAELLRPDVVVLDSRLPDDSGVELCRRLGRTVSSTHPLPVPHRRW